MMLSEQPSATPSVVVSPVAAGEVTVPPPTFLERWGIVFLGWAGGWILVVSTVVLIYFLWKQPALPNVAGLSSDQIHDVVTAHKLLYDQWRDALNYVFDLLVTKTALPVVTLLLGYLFGRAKANS
ncbi:MAG: hypothetical protein ACR2JE_05720 [Acidobacteriaceae bacterium]